MNDINSEFIRIHEAAYKTLEVKEKAINIILDETDPPAPVFVEIESDDGKSIKIGERSVSREGYTVIRITAKDIENLY